MFHFHWPWLALLIPLPLLMGFFLLKQKSVNPFESQDIYFPAVTRLKQAFASSSKGVMQTNRLFNCLLLGVWSCLVVALMQPEKVNQFLHVKNEGYDLMLAVDISGSMEAVDFSTQTQIVSRLGATKEVVSQFLNERAGDRIGLIVFGEKAYLTIPLTLDALSVNKALQDTVAGMAGNATAIGDAIGLSVKTLRERPEGSRVLILLTDGEDNSSSIPPLEATKLAKQYGIRIYTIGVGKNGPVPFPNGHGGYVMAQMPLDEKLLKEIAAMTGGHYFQATDKHALESIYTKINEMEKTESDQTLHLIREPFYSYPLGLGIALLFLLSLYELFYRRKV